MHLRLNKVSKQCTHAVYNQLDDPLPLKSYTPMIKKAGVHIFVVNGKVIYRVHSCSIPLFVLLLFQVLFVCFVVSLYQ